MVQWQRHIFPILRRIHKGLEPANHSATNLALYHSRSSLSQGQLQRQWSKGVPSISRPFDHRFQYQGISTSTQLLKNSSEEAPASSPLVPVSSFGSSQGQEQNKKVDKVQAILKKIKQSPKKVNLVAALVRGMLVKDALLQLQVLVKRASKTVYQVIHSARANASHNHGLNADRLIVAEAFVGKGDFKKRVSIHGKGRSGIMHRPECRLTVVLREITPEEEAQIARLKVHNFKKLTKKEGRLVPHQLIETTPVWGRKNKSSSQDETTPWKRIPKLLLRSSTLFRLEDEKFLTFVSKILTLRDNSVALHILDFECDTDHESELVPKILNYVRSHNTQIQQLGISITRDSDLLMPCVSSCLALTSLMLSVYHIRHVVYPETIIFPKSLNLPALTSLGLVGFTFCGDENGCAEPFSAFTKLNNLLIKDCIIKDAQIFRISSKTLDSLSMSYNLFDFNKIELAAPNLCTFTFCGTLDQKIYASGFSSVKEVNNGTPDQKIYGSGFSSVKEVNIDAKMFSEFDKSPMILLCWLLDLANLESLTVTSKTLQILSLVPDLLEVKLPSLSNLKSMEIKLEPLEDHTKLLYLVKEAMLKKAAAKSRKEASKLRKAFKAGLRPPSVPDGIVDFLLQNSPSAKVNITSDY